MKRLAAALMASTTLYVPASSQTTAAADGAKAAIGMSSCGVYAFSGINVLGCFDSTSMKRRLVPIHPFEIPSVMGDFTTGSGTTGFVPRIVGKVMLAKYLGGDIACANDQTSAIGAASLAAGNGGDIEMPQGCVRYTSGLVTLPGQHWHGAGIGFESSDPFFSPVSGGVVNYAGEINNNSVSGTHLRYDQVGGSAVTLVGDGAKFDHAWLTNAQTGASFTGSIAVSNGVATLNVSSTGVTGTIVAGQILSGSGVVPDMMIGTGGSGTGGAGTYPLTSVAGPVGVAAQTVVSVEGMTTTPSATGVQLGEKQESDGTQAADPANQTLDTIRVEGFGTDVDVQSGQFWSISNFALHGAGLYGVRARNFNYPDSGDGILQNGTIYGHGIDGVRYEFGGGLKMFGTKILGGPHAFEIAVPDTLTYTVRGASAATTIPINTSDVFVPLGNSFENQTAGTIVLGCSGPRNAGMINGLFFDMQIAAPGDTTTAAQNSSGFVSNGCVNGVDIGGGYGGFGSGAINLNGGAYYTVHPRGIGGLSGPGLTIAAGVLGVTVPFLPPITFNKSHGSGYYNIVDNRTNDDGTLDRSDVRYVNVQQSTGSTPLYAIVVPAYRGARVTVQAEGTIAGVGEVNVFKDVLINNTGRGVVSPVTITSAGATSHLNFVFTPSGGQMTVGLQANGQGDAGAFTGSVTFKAQGKTSIFQKL